MLAVLALGTVLLTAGPVAAAEYLPVCEKCLNPRVLSKSGAGTSAALAEAKVTAEDAARWCAAHRPRDPYCATEEVKNGGDGGRKSYQASADCNAGVLRSMDSYEYRYAGTWPDGPGLGRAMLKDAGGNIRRWNSIRSGYGIARSEWDRFGGYSLTGQWETLCGTAAPKSVAQAGGVGAAAQGTSRPARPADAVAAGEWLAICSRCPTPGVTSKSGIGTANAVAEARMMAAELKNWCAESEPQSVGACVQRELAESRNKVYRATADCTAGRITATDEQRYTLAGIWDKNDIGAGRTKWRGADGQIVGSDNASGGLGISQQWELLCPGGVNASLLNHAAAAPARPAAAAPARPAGAAPAPRPAATAPAVCTGKRYCHETDTFAVVVRDFRPSTISNSIRIVSATLQFLNKTNRPLILGYLRNAAVATDERGNRYTLASAESVRGMGEIAGRQFDPKFTLAPGQTADTRFEFTWRWNGRDILGQKAWDVELAVREANEVATGQYRFGAEHAVQFRGVPVAAAMASEAVAPGGAAPGVMALGGASGSAPLAETRPAPVAETRAEPVPEVRRTDGCAGKPRCFDAGIFVAEIQHVTLTREGTYQDRVARLNVMIRNTGQQPLSLAYVAKSSVLTDNLGNRFFWGNAGTYDMSATGIGKVEANRADPQLTLAPGESRAATFTLRRRAAKSDPDGASYTYNVTLAELQVINPQQVRTTREHSIMFADFALNSAASAPAATGLQTAPVRSTEQSIRDLSNAIRGLGRKKR